MRPQRDSQPDNQSDTRRSWGTPKPARLPEPRRTLAVGGRRAKSWKKPRALTERSCEMETPVTTVEAQKTFATLRPLEAKFRPRST